MKKFIALEIEIVDFDCKDVITASLDNVPSETKSLPGEKEFLGETEGTW